MHGQAAGEVRQGRVSGVRPGHAAKQDGGRLHELPHGVRVSVTPECEVTRPCVQTDGQATSLQAVWPSGVQLLRRQQAGAALQARQAPAGVPGLLHRPPGDQK